MIDKCGDSFSQVVRIGIISRMKVMLILFNVMPGYETCALDILMDFHKAMNNAGLR